MARNKPRITVRFRDEWTGQCWTVKLHQAEVIGRFWPEYNGRRSKKQPVITTTLLSRFIARWINRQQQKAFVRDDLRPMTFDHR